MGSALSNLLSACSPWEQVFLVVGVGEWGGGDCPPPYRHGPYKKRLKNRFTSWSFVRPSMSLRHMHHCMSMNALEQGRLGLEAAKASDIDDFV